MNFFQIECFIELSKQLNYTKAAQSLYIAQPALSRSISSLEDELGVNLIKRNTRRVSLTPAGEAFLKEAENLMARFSEGISRTKLAAKGIVGKLTVGIYRDSFDPVLSDIILKFKKKCPEIEVELVEESHSGLINAFHKEKVDIILDSNLHHDDSVVAFPIYKLILCAIVSQCHHLADKETIHFSDLREESFISMTRISSPGRDRIIELAMNAGFNPNIVAYASHITSLLMMVACNKGVSILYKHLEPLSIGRVKYLTLVENETNEFICIKWLRENTNPSLEYFSSFLNSGELPLLNKFSV